MRKYLIPNCLLSHRRQFVKRMNVSYCFFSGSRPEKKEVKRKERLVKSPYVLIVRMFMLRMFWYSTLLAIRKTMRMPMFFTGRSRPAGPLSARRSSLE